MGLFSNIKQVVKTSSISAEEKEQLKIKEAKLTELKSIDFTTAFQMLEKSFIDLGCLDDKSGGTFLIVGDILELGLNTTNAILINSSINNTFSISDNYEYYRAILEYRKEQGFRITVLTSKDIAKYKKLYNLIDLGVFGKTLVPKMYNNKLSFFLVLCKTYYTYNYIDTSCIIDTLINKHGADLDELIEVFDEVLKFINSVIAMNNSLVKRKADIKK